MKKFFKPEMEIIELGQENIITASNVPTLDSVSTTLMSPNIGFDNPTKEERGFE